MEKGFEAYKIHQLNEDAQKESARSFRKFMDGRRTIRSFSSKAVPRQIIRDIIMTASSAPSGAHKQPWHFCAISNKDIQKEIRLAAEEEEYLSYTQRMSEEWKADLARLKTNWEKPYLEIAPWLIAVFMEPYELIDGEKKMNYYVKESVGLATGFLLTAIYNAGLASLTYTPSPMRFLSNILTRPVNQKPYLLIPVGYPADDAEVPVLERKGEEKVISFYT